MHRRLPAQQEIILQSLKSYGWSSDALLAAPEQLDPGIGADQGGVTEMMWL